MKKIIFALAITLTGCSSKIPANYKCTDLESKQTHNITLIGNSLKYDAVEMEKYDTKKVKFASDEVKIDTSIDVFKNKVGNDYVSMTKHEGKLIYVYASNVNADKAVSMGICN
ncbi:hypothetical protein F384_12730 [Citrobacter amalonaticus Y19]|uniref:Lipoprotein n=1 Tax=Citrobacter amalonaticus Y19 TaxID=1261127 RepID=A0A0F6RFF8_CITAM|nr:hypothetical protein [Citrobacter amalonaticus]AKE59370.1 hypothetical protein F384_12730 [Citrobacter amalonaticus Y19]